MMKRILLLTFVFTMILIGCKNETNKNTESSSITQNEEIDSSQAKSVEKGKILLVNTDEAERLMQQENLQLVDVRTPEELEENGKIAGSLNMIYKKNFKEKITSLDREKPVMVYCHSGRRSAICTKILQDAGFKTIYDLDGGITQWKKDGKPVVQ